MAIVENLNLFGLDIPFTDKSIATDPSIKLGVSLGNLAGEFRHNKILRRDLVVRSSRWVTLFLAGPQGYGESLFDNQINDADIEIEEDKIWPFARKIRYKDRVGLVRFLRPRFYPSTDPGGLIK